MPGIDLRHATTYYYLCVALLVAWILLCRRIVGSRFGMALRSLKQNQRRSVALGLAPLRYRLIAFTVSAAGTGLAGVLWANYALFVSPDMTAWQKSGELMAMVILGGIGSIFGPVIGAAVFIGLEQVLTGWTEHWMLVMGPVAGAGGPVRSARPVRAGRSRSATMAESERLALRGLRKSFGALRVTDDVSLTVRAGELHALIGPNGAGKTTLISQITGELQPDAGAVVVDGHDITRLPAHRRAAIGSGAIVPDQPDLSRIRRRGQRCDGGPGARTRRLEHVGQRAP